LGHQEGRRVFREGPKFLNMSNIFNYVQHIFPGGGENFSKGVFATPGYGPDSYSSKLVATTTGHVGNKVMQQSTQASITAWHFCANE